MIFLVSVPNTGTRTIMGILDVSFSKVSIKHSSEMTHFKGRPVYSYHHATTVDGVRDKLCEKSQECEITIFAMRHPIDTAGGWIKRGRSLKDLIPSWEILFDVYRNAKNPFFLPVDTDDRDERLRAISESLGEPLETNWPHVGRVVNKRPEPIEGVTMKDIHEYCRDNENFLQFGYKI